MRMRPRPHTVPFFLFIILLYYSLWGVTMDTDPFDNTVLRYDPTTALECPVPERKVELKSIQRRIKGRFIPPIPMPWFDRAAVLPGKALAVGMVLWYLARRGRSQTVVLTQAALKQHGLGRWAKYRALKALESAGLVSVRRRDRKNPQVTLLDSSAEPASPSPAW
jgi:hypothetical protein